MTAPVDRASRIERVHAMLSKRRGERVVVAWSGGLDSTVLLDMAHQHGLDVLAVHVDHGLRPTSSRDAAFCARAARRMGVPLEIERLHVRGPGSSQERARLQRYAVLARAARRFEANTVMCAHHGEDALETALLNRERNAGLFGVTSLLRTATEGPIPSWPPRLAVERPLLPLVRAQIESYALERDLRWIDDPTNAERDYRRNHIRYALLPRLTDGGQTTLAWLASLEALAERADQIDARARDLLAASALAPLDAESRVMRTEPMRDCGQSERARVLSLCAAQVDCALGREHIEALGEALVAGESTRVSVSGGEVSVEQDLLFVERARGRGGKFLAQRRAPKHALDEPGGRTIRWFGTDIVVRPAPDSPASPTITGASPVLSGGGRRVGPAEQRRVPRPLRWRWPTISTAEAEHALDERAIFVQVDTGDSIQVEWRIPPNTGWFLVADSPSTTEGNAPRKSSVAPD